MKVKVIMDNTTNRGEFNRAYKMYLERKVKIHCSYCKYHKGENKTSKWYGGRDYTESENHKHLGCKIKYPNWKLVSKNRKQWMNKPIKIERKESHWFINLYYIDITW